MREFSGKITADRSWGGAVPSSLVAGLLIQLKLTGTGEVSSTLNSRTLYSGERIAAIVVQPRATHSSAFMVVESSRPKAFEHISLNHGTREAPPQTSTVSTLTPPEAALAASRTSLTFFIIGLHISRKSSRLIWLPKSSSSMRHSQEMLASVFAERIFFVLVTASSSLNNAFLFDNTSHPVFFLNCAAKVLMRHSSMSLPPTLSHFSHKTVNLPRTYWTIATENTTWPIWQNATVCGFSGSKLSVRK
mmetsp:Transcript_45087/g.96250  ORF Transcript_45087/g.96250 Transcript_45087/m.96250 type:complete len:247 (+) Transcript_45087:1130-1870(+)